MHSRLPIIFRGSVILPGDMSLHPLPQDHGSAASGTLTVYHQFILPVPPSPYSPIGDYYFRLAIYNNGYGCSSFSDVIHLNVTSTITIEAGGPSDVCQNSGPVPLTGATVLGNANPASGRGGTWSITSGGGTLSNYRFCK